MGTITQSTHPLEELRRRTGGKLRNPREAKHSIPNGFSIDSRTLQPGNVFIAIHGKRLDGHAFLRQAREKGAAAFVVDAAFYQSAVEGYPNLIVVPDTVKALQKLARSVRKEFSGACVGITGSSGKTTTKEIARQFLQSKFDLLATDGNKNNYIGLPLTLLKLGATHEAIVAELGASYPGEIRELAQILEPNWGVITNVYPCHLEGFGSLEKIYETKIQLAQEIETCRGTVIVNGDDRQLVSLVKSLGISPVTFGTQSDCNYAITREQSHAWGIEFEVNGRTPFRLATHGHFNVMNALAALALGAEMDLDLVELGKILAEIELPKSRYQLISLPQGIRLIDDAYNSNPTSLRLSVESFEVMKTDGRKILVAADMLELGEREKEFHRSLGEGMAQKAIDVVVTVGSLMKEFLAGLHSVPDHRPVTYGFDTNDEAKEFLKTFLKSGDLVLFKGSRAMKLEEIIQCFTPSSIR